MLKNYLIIAWRNIKRNKAYSALNIVGLAVGLAVFILIMLFVRTETSYDRYHANARNIYRVVQEQPGNVYLGSNVFAVTPGPLAAAMARDFPEVLKATRIENWSNVLVRVGDKSYLEKRRPLDRPSDLRDLLLSDRSRRPVLGPRGPVLGPVVGERGPPLLRRVRPGRPDDIP